MPDYDPTSIPILNDVIDTEKTGDTELDEKTRLSEAEQAQAKNNLDLFAEEAEPQIGIIDEDIESALEDIESALIDYDTDTEEPDIVTDAQPLAAEQIISEDAASLKSVVDDITRQLMPNLEQWLRFLIQQALEDRLPDEVVSKLTSNKKKPD